MQCDRLLFDEIDNCALNYSVSDSGLVLTRSATDPTGAGSNLPWPSFSSISFI